MNLSRHILCFLATTLLCSVSALAQPGFKVDIEKPKPYEERKLKSEKTGEGKLKGPKRVLQNLTTRFNYYFNANAKLNEVLEEAKARHKDDFSELLSFYNYTLDATAADSVQLDSVTYKARTGLANHDLRNEWTDELYLLWAQAWHLQKKFDSASLLLQFINYAYGPQYEAGFYKPIGTNLEGARELSIVTPEEKKFLHNNQYSRNTAFIWQIRTRIELEDMTGARSLLTTLRRDPAFPQRLNSALDEAEAYWYYRQQAWDSAAVHLLAALRGDYPKAEKARWRYLAAQMLEKAGHAAEAAALFENVIAATPDPVMEVFARLNLVRLSRAGGADATDKNVAELLKMARKDKYEDYRDLIYFMAAQMELERNNLAAASELLIRGAAYNNGNTAARNKAFLQLADVLYARKKYFPAAAFYDSVQVAGLAAPEADRVSSRQNSLRKLVFRQGVVYRQDSLQRLAALPQDEREAFVKALAKKLRKQQGLKEESLSAGALPAGNAPADLFGGSQKGEWYFYNSNAKAGGTAQFKSVWGNRPNVDNWRRLAAVSLQAQQNAGRLTASPDNPAFAAGTPAGSNDLSFEGLLGRLPLTPEALKLSDDSIRSALFEQGTTYLNEIEDYPAAIETFEELRRRYPNASQMEDVLFNLFYAYGKTGNTGAAAQVRSLLNQKYPASRRAVMAATGKDPLAKNTAGAATKAYENVYNLFIEGRFAEAESAKRQADSTYKTNYWEPQLLYIESVYYIRQRQDSVAKVILATIIRQNTSKALTEKATTMIDVLNRRKQIEEELTRLQISRPSEASETAAQPVALQKPVPAPDTVAKLPPAQPNLDSLARVAQKHLRDSLTLAKATEKKLQDARAAARRDSVDLAKKQAAQVQADLLAAKALAAKLKQDSLAQVKADREQARKDSLALAKALREQARDSLALFRYQEKRRQDSLAKVSRDSLALVKKKAADARRDSLAAVAAAKKMRRDSLALVQAAREQALKDSLILQAAALKRRQDSIAEAKRQPVASPEGYVYRPEVPHNVLVILDKVDPVFVNEAKNAFFRYNREKYSEQPMDVQIINLSSEKRLLVIGNLPTAAAATDYVQKARGLAATEIIPWLTGNKYSFSIISVPNLQILEEKADMGAYQAFLEKHLPEKFK